MYQLANAGETELLSVGPFLGLDASTSTYFVDPNHSVDMLNAVPNRKFLGFVTAQGRVAALAANYPSQSYGFVKFVRTALPSLYVAAVNSGGNGALYQSQLAGTPAAMTLPTGITLTPSLVTSFVQYQQWLFECNNTDTPLKFDTTLAGTRWGIAPPASAPTPAGGAAGVITGTGYYVVTFGNANQESSSGVFSGAVTVTLQQINLTGIPVSTDTQVTLRNIYRLGFGSGLTQLVGTINDNTTTTFTDNTATLNIVGQTLIPHRDIPQPFYDLEVHKDRIWGFGYAGTALGTNAIPANSDLWFSNYSEPWGFDNVNGVIPIERNAGGDIAVKALSLGSVLLCLKTKSTHLITGDTPNDFLRRKAFDIGCISKKSAKIAYGIAYWLSDQGVYSFDGGQLNYVSKQIKKVLDGFSQATLQGATAFVRDRIYYLSFPTQGITYGLDTQTGEWHKLGWATDSVVYDLDNLNEVTAFEPGQAIVDSWFAAETDLGLAISSSYTSRVADSGALQSTKRYRHAVVQALVQPGATATVQVIVDPGPTNKTVTRVVNLGIGPPRHLISLPPNMVGFEAQMLIIVSSSAQTEVQKAAVYGWLERSFVAQG